MVSVRILESKERGKIHKEESLEVYALCLFSLFLSLTPAVLTAVDEQNRRHLLNDVIGGQETTPLKDS